MAIFNGLCFDASEPFKTVYQEPLLRFATVGTIRLSFLKLGARITISCRRILIAIATACPYQDILGIAYSRIQAIPDSG